MFLLNYFSIRYSYIVVLVLVFAAAYVGYRRCSVLLLLHFLVCMCVCKLHIAHIPK